MVRWTWYSYIFPLPDGTQHIYADIQRYAGYAAGPADTRASTVAMAAAWPVTWR